MEALWKREVLLVTIDTRLLAEVEGGSYDLPGQGSR